jgi:hypothetical protein
MKQVGGTHWSERGISFLLLITNYHKPNGLKQHILSQSSVDQE